MESAPVVPLRRFTRHKEDMLWNWVPGLAGAVADRTVDRYLRSFFHVWNTSFPVPRRRRIKHSTYLRKVEEREQILALELFRRLELWKQQQLMYGDYLSSPNSASTSSGSSSSVSPDSSLELDTDDDRPRDISNLISQTPVDSEGAVFLQADHLQQTDSMDFLDFSIPPYESSAADLYLAEPEDFAVAPAQTLYSDPGPSSLASLLHQVQNSGDHQSLAIHETIATENYGVAPLQTLGADAEPSSLPTALDQVPNSKSRQSPAICETAATNAGTIETLLQWIEALKQNLSVQHRAAGCEVCYGVD